MPRSGKLTLAAAALVLLFAAQAAHADPLTFSNVRAAQSPPNSPSTTVFTDLYANPGVVLTNGTQLSFLIDVSGTLPAGATDTLRLTLGLPDGSQVVSEYQIPLFGSVFPPFTLVSDIFDVPTYYEPRPFTLTVDLLGSNPDFVIPSGPSAGQGVNSYTYTFSVVQPVPEPATVLLLATGLGGVFAGARRRRRLRE